MSTTTNLADFGYREKRMAAELLNKMCDGIPDDSRRRSNHHDEHVKRECVSDERGFSGSHDEWR